MAWPLVLLLWTAAFALSQLLAPDPEEETIREAKLNDFNFPTATEGRVIPLHWGTDMIKGPNVLWYGDLKVIPIRENVTQSMFNDREVTVGYEYRVGIQFGICHGPAVLKAVYIGDKRVWSGTQSTTDRIWISHHKENLYGYLKFYNGSQTQ